MNTIRSIVIRQGMPVKIVSNPTRYPLIGKGLHGAVFKLSKSRCVKIFPNKRIARREISALFRGQRSSVFPRLLKRGPNYVIMEYISGTSLHVRLKKAGSISESFTKKILYVLKELERLGFTRRDAALRHLKLTSSGKLKVIDHANSMKRIDSKPRRLLIGLDKMGLKVSFLNEVKKLDPYLYRRWITE